MSSTGLESAPAVRDLHSSTFQLNVSAFCGIRSAFTGHLGCFTGVGGFIGCFGCVLCQKRLKLS